MLVDEKRSLDTFLELVKIYSPSKKEDELADVLVDKLSLLNIEVELDSFGNIVAFIPANSNIVAPSIMFSAHMDVVEPCINVKPQILTENGGKIIKSSGDTVLGADDKAGLTMILEAVSSIIEADTPHGNIELVFTRQEENGMWGAKALDTKKLNSKIGFIIDHSDPIGTVITQAPQHEKLSFTFKGRSAHAGIKPEEGINAILVAAKAISLMPTGKLDEESTANVGIINGGIATNIVPDECIINCEIRSQTAKKVDLYRQKFINAAKKAIELFPGTTFNHNIETEYKNINIKVDEPIIKYAQKAAQNMNLPFKTVSTCGGSDANIFNYHGITTVCLGAGYENPHSTSEFITLNNLVLGTNYIIEIINTVIKKDLIQ